ncbi:MAG: PD-(D/E)XK nuclease family protein [Ignisphaera sp.]
MGSNNSTRELLFDLIKCRKKNELLNKKMVWESGKALLDCYDITRCGFRYRYQLDDSGIEREIERASKEEAVFKRIIFSEGFLQVFKDVSDNYEIIGEKRYSRQIDVEIDNEKRRVIIEAVCDAYLPRYREAVIVRHIKHIKDREKIKIPKIHHIEQAALIQWISVDTNDYIERVRLIYYIGFGKAFEEYVIETKISESYVFRTNFEKRVIDRIIYILKGQGPIYDWECRYCPHRDVCNKKIESSASSVKNGVKPLIHQEGNEWRCYRDITMKNLMILLRKLIERDIEISERVLEHRSIPIIRVHVTDLIYCPLKYWYNNYIPYLQIADKIKPSIIRGEIVHRGIARILNEMNRCIDIAERKLIERIDIEKKLMKPYVVDQTMFTVEGRADAIVRHRGIDHGKGPMKIIEIKTSEKKYTSSQKHHEDQLKWYLSISGEDDVSGEIIYVYEGDDGKIQFESKHINERFTNDKIMADLKKLLDVAKGEIDPNTKCYAQYDWECKYCYFRYLCPSSCQEHKSRKP